MPETPHRFGVFLSRVSWIGAFQAESSRSTQEWEVGWTATQNQNLEPNKTSSLVLLTFFSRAASDYHRQAIRIAFLKSAPVFASLILGGGVHR
jgi:hypothetical protein